MACSADQSLATPFGQEQQKGQDAEADDPVLRTAVDSLVGSAD